MRATLSAAVVVVALACPAVLSASTIQDLQAAGFTVSITNPGHDTACGGPIYYVSGYGNSSYFQLCDPAGQALVDSWVASACDVKWQYTYPDQVTPALTTLPRLGYTVTGDNTNATCNDTFTVTDANGRVVYGGSGTALPGLAATLPVSTTTTTTATTTATTTTSATTTTTTTTTTTATTTPTTTSAGSTSTAPAPTSPSSGGSSSTDASSTSSSTSSQSQTQTTSATTTASAAASPVITGTTVTLAPAMVRHARSLAAALSARIGLEITVGPKTVYLLNGHRTTSSALASAITKVRKVVVSGKRHGSGAFVATQIAVK